MIKKFKKKTIAVLVFTLLFLNSSLAFSPKIEKEIYIGCYSNSKQYIGSERAKEYCLCTIAMLDRKYNDEDIDRLFKKKPEEILKSTEFASIHCQKNKKAF
jgi:hypothetical protein